MRKLSIAVAMLALHGCARNQARKDEDQHVTLIFTAEVRGALEPCGCESEPLGDAARLAALIRKTPGATWLDAGELEVALGEIPPEKQAQEQLKAKLWRRIHGALGGNLSDLPVRMVAGDQRSALKTAESERVVVVQGRKVGEGLVEPLHGGLGWVVAPADRLRRVGFLELVLRGSEISYAGSPDALLRRVAFLKTQLGGWTAGNPFVLAKRAEVAELEKQAKQWQPPTRGSYFQWRLVPLRRDLPRDPEVASWITEYDRQVDAINRRRAANEKPVALKLGQPGYVGSEACARCHASAYSLWRETAHAKAYETLRRLGKAYNESCIPCHVTGFRRPGGATLEAANPLRFVGCESCHGPGSIHVDDRGLDEPVSLSRQVPETVCLGCHQPDHSDTFEFHAYLRDVTGDKPANEHGAKLRQKLGPGPTASELRHKNPL